MTVSVPPRLREAYQDGRLLIFVGSGISSAVEWENDGDAVRGVSWGELVGAAAELIVLQNLDRRSAGPKQYDRTE